MAESASDGKCWLGCKTVFYDTDGMEQYPGLVCTHWVYHIFLTSHYSHKYITLSVITQNVLWNENQDSAQGYRRLVPPSSQYCLLGGYSTHYGGAKAPIVAIVHLDQVWMDICILSGILGWILFLILLEVRVLNFLNFPLAIVLNFYFSLKAKFPPKFPCFIL